VSVTYLQLSLEHHNSIAHLCFATLVHPEYLHCQLILLSHNFLDSSRCLGLELFFYSGSVALDLFRDIGRNFILESVSVDVTR
jgi:hypothetical protein